MKKPLLAFSLVALAGMAVGQATTSFIPIARWLGFYQREDISQVKLWNPVQQSAGYAYLPITEPISIIKAMGQGPADMHVVEWDPVSETEVGVLFEINQGGTPDDLNPNHHPLRLDPGMFGATHTAIRLVPARTTYNGNKTAILMYRTL